MVGENKNSVFENWLAAYGSHLEGIATTRLSGSDDAGSHKLPNAETKQKQSN